MKNKEFGSVGGNIKHPNKAVREFYEPLSNLELAVNLLTVLSVPVAILGAHSFSTIKNKIQKMTSRRIIEKLGEKQIKVDGYTKTQLEKLLADLQDSLDKDDGESAKEIALTIRQIAKDRPTIESKKTPSTMPKQRDPNWRTMQAKATSGAGGRHRDEKRAVKQGDVKHKKDLIPIESIEEDAFYNMVDWYKSAGLEQRESVDKHPAFRDHPEQLEKLKSAANIQEDDGVAASPQLQRAHQRERERRGLPHPDEYLRMIEKKKKEIAAMRAQDLEKDVKEAQDPDEGYMDRVISDLHKDSTGVRPDHEWGNWWMSLSYEEKVKVFNDMVDGLGASVKEGSDWGEPEELLTDVMTALERQVEWPLTDVMDRREVQSLLQPVRDAINAKMKNIGQGVQEGGGDTHLKRLEYDVRQLIDMGEYDAAKEHAALAPTADLRTHLRKIIRKAMISPKSKNQSTLKKSTIPSGLSVKQYVAQQMEDEYGDGNITFHRDRAGGYNVRHTNDTGEIHSHQYNPRTGKVDLRNIVGSTEESVSEDQTMSIQDLATISDEALDKAYGYGRSTPGNTFGWQANLMSAAYAKKMIDAGVTDIEKISDAIHKGWNVTAQKFVQDPDQFDDTEKLRQAGKLEAKLQQRAKLMKINYAQLDNDEQEKDRVVARALLQAIKGQQAASEGTDFFDRFGLPIMPDDDGKFRDMMRGIKRGTKKQAAADRRERDAASRERARAAFGPSPADKLSIRRDQGVAEGSLKEFRDDDDDGGGDDRDKGFSGRGSWKLNTGHYDTALDFFSLFGPTEYQDRWIKDPKTGGVTWEGWQQDETDRDALGRSIPGKLRKMAGFRWDNAEESPEDDAPGTGWYYAWSPDWKDIYKRGRDPKEGIDRINKQGVREGNDDWGSMSHGEFKRRELQHELGHETNNVSIDINGKPWKVLKGESENPRRALARAEKIAATIKKNALMKGRKEPKVDVYVTGAPATE